MTPAGKEVAFGRSQARLAGTLLLPGGDGRGSAVVLAHGLANDRDEAGQFLLLAKRLRAAGHGVLRFDFRGCGRSAGERGRMLVGGEWPHDLLTALAYRRSRAEVDPDRVGVVGASWGGGVAVHAAAADGAVRCVVTTRSGGSEVTSSSSCWRGWPATMTRRWSLSGSSGS